MTNTLDYEAKTELGTIVRGILIKLFDKHKPRNKVFLVNKPNKTLIRLANILSNDLGWKEIEKITTLNVLDLVISTGVDLSDWSAGLPNRFIVPQFLLLHVGPSRRRTNLFTHVEKMGYRIFRELSEFVFLYQPISTIKTISSGHTLEDSIIHNLLGGNSRKVNYLPKETRADCISVEGPELLTPSRFDIAIKSHYARLWLKNLAKNWREFVYSEQAVRITGPGKEIIEYGTKKRGIEAFYENFHSLLGNVKPDTIPHVPVDSALVVFDGSHRISAAIATKRRINCVRIYSNAKRHAGVGFFTQRRGGHSPCPQVIIDEAALEYCRIKDSVAIALIFPAVTDETKAIDELKEVADIVYRKDILLSPEAGGSVLRQVYEGHSWLKENEKRSGFLHKKKSCFPYSGMLRVLLLDQIETQSLRKVKEKIRSIYSIGNHSIHITDSSHETVRVARALFNRNSVELLKMGIGSLPGFHEIFFLYRNWVEANSIDEEMVCIDGSAILSLLGLRECNDIDFLYHGDASALPPTPNRIDCHNDLQQFHKELIPDILGDPRLHCWYMGVKFCAPQIVLEMKENRAESKDRQDVLLLRSKIQKSTGSQLVYGLFIRVNSFISQKLASLSRKIKRILPQKTKDLLRRLNEKIQEKH